MILLAYVRHNYKDYILQVLVSSVVYGTSNNLYREYKNIKPRSAILLTTLSLISVTVFFYLLTMHFSPDFSKYNSFLIIGLIFASLVLLVLLNKLINIIFGIIFLQQDISAEYNHNIDFFNQSAGLVLYPVSILIVYSNISVTSIYIGLFSLALIYLLRIFRLLKINFNKQINIFYMFLYLCTVEIIPIIYTLKHLIKF